MDHSKVSLSSINTELIWKDAIYKILELSKYSNYLAVLFETGLLPMEDVINCKKKNFVNKLVHIKGKGQCLRTATGPTF